MKQKTKMSKYFQESCHAIYEHSVVVVAVLVASNQCDQKKNCQMSIKVAEK